MRRRMVVVLLAVSAVVVSLPPAVGHSLGGEPLQIVALSNRADLVSGGDVLLEVLAPAAARVRDVKVAVAGRDVTDRFAVRDGGRLIGLVDGLKVGANRVTATLPDGSGAYLDVTNHPRGGPAFSGPQIQPWYCLDGAKDAQCNRPTAITWQYRNSRGNFASYDPGNPPSDVATTTTDEGRTVPYVVRVETGNLNRSQYRIAMLSHPDEKWAQWAGPEAWNHKVYVTHGGGCAMGHSEGVAPDVMEDIALSRGFVVMSHALEHNTENCNLVVQAESVLMTKEHLIEEYGHIRYTMGVGCSGGSIAELHMANAFPGLYDGLIAGCTYPDLPVNDLLDCPALMRYFTGPSRWGPGVVWTERHMAEAAGLQSISVCASWLETFSPMFDPTRGSQVGSRGGDLEVGDHCDVPTQEPERVYHPETNPTGVRCTFQDYLINLVGRRPPDRWGEVEKKIGQGFANRFYDNVGLQYGLRALMEGSITQTQFVDLNASVGSVGIDYETLPERVEGDPMAITTSYRAGVTNEANELDRVPIIDIPITGDRYEFHDNYKSWALRQRLLNSNGHADNHVIWYGPDEQGNPDAMGDPRAFATMDEWLAAMEADRRDIPVQRKVVDNRPDEARDRCDVPDETTCDLVFGSAGNIRWAAGQLHLANDVIKCRLKALQRNDYAPVHFTEPQWARLQEAFPRGVCDWTRRGAGQQPSVPWQTYEDGPGGRPMGEAPVSVPFGPDGRLCADVPVAVARDRDRARVVHRRAVDCVVYTRISIGVAPERYGPTRSVSRGQMASFLVNALRVAGVTDLPGAGGDAEFTDTAGSVHEANINRLARAGVVSGVGGGRFDPAVPITRAQMASFMVAAARFGGVSLPRPADHFADVSGAHAESVNAGFEAGLFSGTTVPDPSVARSGRFSPARHVLRDQMATFLVNAVQLLFASTE